MSLNVHAEIHGLAGRAGELRDLLAEHAARLRVADGCLGASAAEVVGEVAEFLLIARWRDEEALRAHYVTLAEVAREVRAQADLSEDPTRQG